MSESMNIVRELSMPDPVVAKIIQPDYLKPRNSLLATVLSVYGLPFYSPEILNRLPYAKASESQYIEDIEIPISRIVSASNFQSWAGRGFYKGKIIQKHGRSSAGVIHDYSHRPPDLDANGISMEYFKDIDGEVWSWVAIGGTHRTAAAKLRNNETILGAIVTNVYDDLPSLPYSISEEMLRFRHGRTIRDRAWAAQDASRLAKESQKLDKVLSAKHGIN